MIHPPIRAMIRPTIMKMLLFLQLILCHVSFLHPIRLPTVVVIFTNVANQRVIYYVTSLNGPTDKTIIIIIPMTKLTHLYNITIKILIVVKGLSKMYSQRIDGNLDITPSEKDRKLSLISELTVL